MFVAVLIEQDLIAYGVFYHFLLPFVETPPLDIVLQ